MQVLFSVCTVVAFGVSWSRAAPSQRRVNEDLQALYTKKRVGPVNYRPAVFHVSADIDVTAVEVTWSRAWFSWCSSWPGNSHCDWPVLVLV